MRAFVLTLTAALLAVPAGTAIAKQHKQYEYDGRYYSSYEQCRAAKKRAANRGTVIGAAAAGAGTALLGGNLGTSLLGAGVGAVAGHEIGKSSEKC